MKRGRPRKITLKKSKARKRGLAAIGARSPKQRAAALGRRRRRGYG